MLNKIKGVMEFMKFGVLYVTFSLVGLAALCGVCYVIQFLNNIYY